MSQHEHETESRRLSRRALLKSLGLAPLLLRPAPFHGASFIFDSRFTPVSNADPSAFTDFRLEPRYPSKSPLEDVLRLVEPGSDEYQTEAYAHDIQTLLNSWGQGLKSSADGMGTLEPMLDLDIQACSLSPEKEVPLRNSSGIAVVRRQFSAGVLTGRAKFIEQLRSWIGQVERVETCEFEITSIATISDSPITARLEIRYDLVTLLQGNRRQELIGKWRTEWSRNEAATDKAVWKAGRWEILEETRCTAQGPMFVDVTSSAFSGVESYEGQLLRGSDYWRTVIDGASGIDVYGNNGVAAGDYDNDGFDDLYLCQPAGLPNRLYRNRGDGSFEDVTEKAGVGVLDNTSCALFADFRNIGLQDLLVVCGAGPLLFVNQGNGTFAIKRDAFKFAQPPEGTFTHAAISDYDRDGRLDIYLCLYSYYLGLDQYHYPVPYFDARNGPPNFLLHNEGGLTFVDRTEAAGLRAENDRYSFACAWGECAASGYPDLYVANDFGRNNLYRNNGNGTFTAVSAEAHIQDVGAGMSATWADVDLDGKQDIYVSNMWSAAGQRVSEQAKFHDVSQPSIREQYKRHARGNALYRNQDGEQFENVTEKAGVEVGRWAWSSDFWDFDHDGYPDLYVTNGYISSPTKNQTIGKRGDLASFFWRQVVGKSPDDATPTLAYERGWQALNELIRSDNSWSGFERNVMFANNQDGTFSEVSGAVGLDFLEDSRSFALADLNHDGRLEVILKSRNAPQVRILQNAMQDIGHSISFRLRGKKSNRDGVGAAITVEAENLHQTKYLQAGSGFLAQHTKEVFFGIGKTDGKVNATIQWPSGLVQRLTGLPVSARIDVEEGETEYVARPFDARPPAYKHSIPVATAEVMPEQIETWLIEPLRAPDFSLPDVAGNLRELKQFQGGPLLIVLWSTAAPISQSLLILLNQNRAMFETSGLAIAAVNIETPEDTHAARTYLTDAKIAIPNLFATEEFIGIYNIIYRYIFDRRRNIGLPSAFLIDRDGMIVKLYQGMIGPAQVMRDSQERAPAKVERLRRALPFPGALYQGDFSRNDFTFGVAMFQHGYLNQAAESFKQVIAVKPDNPEAFYNLGTLSLRRGDFTNAQIYLDKTIQLRPDYPEAWNNLGMMSAQQGNAEQAIQNFQRSLQLRPNYGTALLNLGNVYRRQGNLLKAKECLERAMELEPGDPETNYSLGMFYAQQSELAEASTYLQRAILSKPNYPEALNNLGVIFVRQQDYARAQEEFETARRLSPEFDQSYLNLARLYILQNQSGKARETLQELLKLKPQNSAAQQALDSLDR